MVMSRMPSHDCIQESKIERINAELMYKKEKLDDLKEDNRRMEEKLDDIKDCMNQLIVKSNFNDSALEARLVAVETKQSDLEAKLDEKKKDDDAKLNQHYVRIGLIVSGISIFIGIIFHFI